MKTCKENYPSYFLFSCHLICYTINYIISFLFIEFNFLLYSVHQKDTEREAERRRERERERMREEYESVKY